MNTATYNRTRWLTLIGTIITQFALGSVYTWSLFNSALSQKLDAPISQVAFSFGLAKPRPRHLFFRGGQTAGPLWRA